MARYLTSGSGFERLALCPASAALPHAHHETVYTERGTAIHAFLEDVSKVGRDEALAAVPDEWRPTCEAIDLTGLDVQLQLAAEVAFAYNVETGKVRELGRGAGRKYDDVTEDELPTTLDVVGVRYLPTIRRGLLADYKAGWQTRRLRVHTLPQMDVGALVMMRAFDLDVVDRHLIHVAEDTAPWVQRDTVERWEMDLFEDKVRTVWRAAKELRAELRTNLMPRDFNTGAWCEMCPAREWCPAQTAMLRSLLNRDFFDGAMRTDRLEDEDIAALWDSLREAKSALKMLTGRILGLASSRTISLGKTSDGEERWLGMMVTESNDVLDGEIAYDVLEEMLGPDVATEATTVTATKKDVDAAIKGAVPRGKGASTMREFLKRMHAANGITNHTKSKVTEWKATPAIAAAAAPAKQIPAKVTPEDGAILEDYFKE